MFICASLCQAAPLRPNEILVVVNGDLAESVQVGQAYCRKRHVPAENLVPLSLGKKLKDRISRLDYDRDIAAPLRNQVLYRKHAAEIHCLLLIYGVPYRVGGRGPLPDSDAALQQDQEALAREKARNQAQHQKESRLSEILKADIARLEGHETQASVDSELALVLFPDYELYRWQPNALRQSTEQIGWRTLMVSRLDGPTSDIARGLIDKALTAESQGLKGPVYIDARGLERSSNVYGIYDRDLVQWAQTLKAAGRFPVTLDQKPAVFQAGTCPDTALYCGWYSLKHYVDAFTFVPGAIGYHIASFEAVHLHDADSTEWCPSLLEHGITATLGAVAEPYLTAFPRPSQFFGALFQGHCLVRAFFQTKPFNSWQLVLIGDPLYRPFASGRSKSAQPR